MRTVLFSLLVATIPAAIGARTSMDSEARYAVLFARPSEQAMTLVMRDLSARADRVVYVSANRITTPEVPDEFGFLPSPDARWVVVWDLLVRREGAEEATRWLAIRLADGRTVTLGETAGAPSLLPRWADADHLVLEGDGYIATFDVRTGKLARPLPRRSGPLAANVARNELVRFCRDHYSDRIQALAALVAKSKRLKLAEFVASFRAAKDEPREYLILRSLGIPGLGELQPGIRYTAKLRVPYLALSPDGAFLARAHHYRHALQVQADPEDAKRTAIMAAAYRVDVVKTSSGARMWSEGFRSRAVSVPPPHGMWVNPAPLPWAEPYIRDIRWTHDGRHLSFTTYGEPDGPTVRIVDALRWSVNVRLPNAINGFVVLAPRSLALLRPTN